MSSDIGAFINKLESLSSERPQISYFYDFIIFDNAVQNISMTSNNTWSSQGDSYALSNAKIRYETLNGWPNPSDYWVAEGQPTKNGQIIGSLGMEEKPLWVEVFLQMTDGDRIEIDRHILTQN